MEYNGTVAEMPHQQIPLLVPLGKASWDLATRSARSYFTHPPYPTMYENTFPTFLYMLIDILSMLKRLKAAIGVFVFGQFDSNFLCVAVIHATRTILKDCVMTFLSFYLKTSLVVTCALQRDTSDSQHTYIHSAHPALAKRVMNER